MPSPTIKSNIEIEKMRTAGKLTAAVLEALDDVIQAGMSTAQIDAFCHSYIVEELNATPGSLGQYDYPYTVNTSINHVVCHGMPSDTKILRSGDIINVDVTVKKDGYYGDSSKMYLIGAVSPHAQRLVTVTQECLYKAIALVKPGTTLGDLGHAIQSHAETNNYSVVRDYCGHGIGESMHEAPQVAHYGKPGKGLVLQEGMTFTIEPMINQGKAGVKVLGDKWTVITKDKRLSAQWEHTLLVTQSGHEVLTRRKEEPFN